MTAVIHSRFCRFIGMAAAVLFCVAPQTASVACLRVSPPPFEAPQFPQPGTGNLSGVLSNSARGGRQVSARLRSGTLAAAVNWAVDAETASDVLRGRVEYSPDGEQCGSCSSIRFMQIARTMQYGGTDYQWKLGEEHRNVLRTSSEMGPGIEDGYFLDHQAYACVPAQSCSPYFRDYWANPADSGDGFQAGWVSAPASLADYPFGWDILEQISLESCARCVDTGEFLGCVQWGARWPQGGNSIAPIRIREGPSPTFLAAFRKFEEFYRPNPAARPPALLAATFRRLAVPWKGSYWPAPLWSQLLYRR
ncbi:exported hypothetical protein [Candidatus Sulfopaludibacter sp. SbA3]|nr:exported hypothetical protein [Candidatus Sulfopaludibacter sp. SbA3]